MNSSEESVCLYFDTHTRVSLIIMSCIGSYDLPGEREPKEINTRRLPPTFVEIAKDKRTVTYVGKGF